MAVQFTHQGHSWVYHPIHHTDEASVITAITQTHDPQWLEPDDLTPSLSQSQWKGFTVVVNPYWRWLAQLNDCVHRVHTRATQSLKLPGVSLARRRLHQLTEWGYRTWCQHILDDSLHDLYRRLLWIDSESESQWLLGHTQSDLCSQSWQWYHRESREWITEFGLNTYGLWHEHTVTTQFEWPLLHRWPDITAGVYQSRREDFERFGYDHRVPPKPPIDLSLC